LSKSTVATASWTFTNGYLAHPKDFYPRLIYWGKYVAHDNNRDAMGMTLKLTQNVLKHIRRLESAGVARSARIRPLPLRQHSWRWPYNAWIDPILATNDMIASRNVADMTKFGMPGVFTHGDFDTWSPGYLMFLAALLNGISRLYETFGNGNADTRRELWSRKNMADVVQAEPAAAEDAVVAARQQ